MGHKWHQAIIMRHARLETTHHQDSRVHGLFMQRRYRTAVRSLSPPNRGGHTLSLNIKKKACSLCLVATAPDLYDAIHAYCKSYDTFAGANLAGKIASFAGPAAVLRGALNPCAHKLSDFTIGFPKEM